MLPSVLRRLLGPSADEVEPIRFSEGLTADVSHLLGAGEHRAAVRLVQARTGVGFVVAALAVDAQADRERT
jgi:hypothetical protein